MIRIIAAGRLKEEYFQKAAEEYIRRLSRYTQLEVMEVADEKAPEALSDALREKVKDAEGARILEKVGREDTVFALTPGGREYTSEEFSRKLEAALATNKGRVAFLIGGSLGLSGAALARADERISFSRLTFPHQLFRVILLEQIYRAFKIMKKEPYHK